MAKQSNQYKEELIVEMAKQFEPLIGEKTMYSVADSLRDEGRQEGRREMQSELIKKLYAENFSSKKIAYILNLELSEVLKIIDALPEEVH